MAFSYNKLWKLLIDNGMTKENFRILIHASPTTIAAMGKGEGISPKVLSRICAVFDCQPGDIMEYIPDHPRQNTLCSFPYADEQIKILNQQTENHAVFDPSSIISPHF